MKINEITIYPLSDLHLGNKDFDYVKYMEWINDFNECESEKIIYCLGDMLDSSVIYNGSYGIEKRKLDKLMYKLKPYIRKSVKGNNDYFIEKNGLKIYDDNIKHSFTDTIEVNNKKYNIYGIHTMNRFILKSEIKNNIKQYDKDVDIYLQGHYHFGYHYEKNNKHYIFNSCFLKNTDKLFKIIINDGITVKEIGE